jgi:lipopolysaccharide/colanic/teichoic acid biosynthesis glycosyltransferase
MVDSLPYKKANWWYRFVKRSFDIWVSLIAILILSPLYLLFIIINAIYTRGHPIFFDKRIGKDHKHINVYKYRSMYYDAETNVDKYLSKAQKKQWKKERKVENDPRVTPFGRFLRKTSIDELPQLFNILFGSMSFVGPRPITEGELTNNFTKEQQDIMLSARPGLIGYWGVKGRSNIAFADGVRQKLELDYFKLRGIWFDLGLMFRVIPAVLKGSGAK